MPNACLLCSSRSQSPSQQPRDGKRRRSDGGAYSAEPPSDAPPLPPMPAEEARGGRGGYDGQEAVADGSDAGPAAMDAEGAADGEGEEAGGGVELDAELTPEEIMMMQQMGMPFVSVAWAVV